MVDIENVITSIPNEYFAKLLQFEDDRRKKATLQKMSRPKANQNIFVVKKQLLLITFKVQS
jgi:hypothetical protein